MNYYHPYGYYPQPYNQSGYWYARQMSPVNTDQLQQSAKQTRILMKEASLVLDKLADSKEFDKKLMTAAQASQNEEVKRLIKSIGVTSDVEVRFSPDGLRLEFISAIDEYDCCKLQIAMRWKRF